MIGSRDYEENEIHNELPPLSERSIRINGEPVGTEPLADISEVAEYLGASVGYVRYLVMKKRIPFYKIERFVRFRMSEIDAWLSEKGSGQRKRRIGKKPTE